MSKIVNLIDRIIFSKISRFLMYNIGRLIDWIIIFPLLCIWSVIVFVCNWIQGYRYNPIKRSYNKSHQDDICIANMILNFVIIGVTLLLIYQTKIMLIILASVLGFSFLVGCLVYYYDNKSPGELE